MRINNKALVLSLLCVILFSCKSIDGIKNKALSNTHSSTVTANAYELEYPIDKVKAVLVLFGGYPESIEDVKQEFKIAEDAKTNGVAVVYMNYAQKLWLIEEEKEQLAAQLQNIFLENKLPIDNMYIGGYSSGGNVSLLISSFLAKNRNYRLTAKGVFIVDSPIDLLALYRSSEKNIERKFSEPSVNESKWIIENLQSNFGVPEQNLSNYEKHAVFTSETGRFDNLQGLEATKIRMYTEPDTTWWKVNRMSDYDQLNAFYIQKLSLKLKEKGFTKVELISTENKGYRANGDRHPHSWSIVDKDALVKWIKE